MNYMHHILIGMGTAALGVAAAEASGATPLPLAALGLGGLSVALGSIATDLDHPKSFISNSIPTRIMRITLAVLTIPVLAGLGAVLTTHDMVGTWTQLFDFIFGVNFLLWALIALFAALGLMLLSWLLYKNLHHRGPLHSFVFAGGMTVLACLTFWYLWQPWYWGLTFGWGWVWHILADGLTEEGVPFFWPFKDVRRHSLPVWARGVGRRLLSLAAVGGLIGLLYFQLAGYKA